MLTIWNILELIFLELRILLQGIVNTLKGTFREEALLNYVFERAEEGNPSSVIKAIDEFAATKQFLMNVNHEKGKIIDDIIVQQKPNVVLELGTYCGYSSIRMANLLKPGSKLISIEKNPLYAAIATKIVEFAGLKDHLTIIVGTADTVIPKLKEKFTISSIGVVFIDHWKDRYFPDLQVIEQCQLLKPGSILIADNVIIPGSPQYTNYVRNNPSYESSLKTGKLEYSTSLIDGIEVSVFKG